MSLHTISPIYFSPTGTTRNVLLSIAQAMQAPLAEQIDLTPSDADNLSCRECTGEMVLIGSPVYAGRLPTTMLSRFKQINGDGRPAVIVVVYGNRAYEDALIELRDAVSAAGFKPIAAAAFIGEHSYSTAATPIAANRPDAADLAQAQEFGKSVRDHVVAANERQTELFVPGNYPYKEQRLLAGIVPIADESLCTKCGSCVPACPVAAISKENPLETAADACIRCCACTKVCPAKAKMFADQRVKDAATMLHTNFSARKEPEFYW